MKASHLLKATALAVALAAGPANADDTITIVRNVYRTGGFSGSGIPQANAIRDYMTLINAKGGVNGVKIAYSECETGYDTKKSIECYEEGKSKHSIVYLPWTTGAALAAIPHAHVDKMPILSMAYGLSASADGNTFPWVFNPPMTYWDGASVALEAIVKKEGGADKLKGKKIGLLHLDAPYGKEPIPFLQTMAKKYGFELVLYPVAPTEMQNQGALWLNVRRDKPDYIYSQSFGAMTPTSYKEAVKAGFPMDHFYNIWWASGDDDARAAGADAKGAKGVSWHATGADFPLVKEIVKDVIEKGQSLTEKGKAGEVLYDRSLYEAVMIVEAIRNAQKLTGKKVINAEDMRRGLETLEISEARWAELGLPNYAAPLKLTCADHNGHLPSFIVEWDGANWKKASDPIKPLTDEIAPLVAAAAADYAKANDLPKRTEPCDAK